MFPFRKRIRDILLSAYAYLRITTDYVAIPLFSVEESKDVLAGHETLLHVTQLQVVHLQHVFLLLLLQRATKKHI